MRVLKVTANEAGSRMDKYVMRYLKKAPASFIYKMIRKKNITLNKSKATGSEILTKGDEIRLFLSDDTIARFTEVYVDTECRALEKDRIVYEDEHIILYNKPVGILSQKADSDDYSLNEMLLSYMKDELKNNQGFVPSICNRLDRNTEGIVIMAKSYAGAAVMNQALKDRTLRKYYCCPVFGQVDCAEEMTGYLIKNSRTNVVRIYDDFTEGAAKIVTAYRPIMSGNKISILEVELITGKSHQIRAHLSHRGFPIVFDSKYGDVSANKRLSNKYSRDFQQLIAYRLVMPKFDGAFEHLSGREFALPIPDVYKEIYRYGNME